MGQTRCCTFGVRSAWRKTVTFAFNSHVGDSGEGVSAAGKGRSKEDDNRIHKAASMSAALSKISLD